MENKEKMVDDFLENTEPIVKRLSNINTMFNFEGDTTLIGVDEFGKEFRLSIPIMELLEWIDKASMVESEIERLKTFY